ncbi:MAG: hypothetical protein JWM51_981 [Microbacteriaceae bacterium]|jgi:hypothetical protein|nr:hypothetical protein [Microbacteriaceae bacterium]
MSRVPSDSQRVLSPTLSHVARRSVFWVGSLVFLIIVAVMGLLFTGTDAASDPLSATNPGPAGAKALAEVLDDRGVTVTVADSLADATAAARDPQSTTLLFFDPEAILDSEQRADAFRLARHVVIVDPSFDELTDLAPDVAQAGDVDGALEAECALAAATKAGTISGDGEGYRYTGGGDAALCFGSGDAVFSVIQVETATGTATGTATVVGARDALSNEFITDRGNAALAVNLLGRSENLVWYIPTVADLATGEAPTLATLSPDWVVPLAALVILTALAAAVWRGRRFGPLIVENLPVTVRANETMRGRARLYEKSRARLRALDALRIGAVERVAVRCGLPRVATVDEVIAAVASLTGVGQNEVRRVLLDAVPANDRDLVRLSDDLLRLERAVAASVIPH